MWRGRDGFRVAGNRVDFGIEENLCSASLQPFDCVNGFVDSLPRAAADTQTAEQRMRLCSGAACPARSSREACRKRRDGRDTLVCEPGGRSP